MSAEAIIDHLGSHSDNYSGVEFIKTEMRDLPADSMLIAVLLNGQAYTAVIAHTGWEDLELATLELEHHVAMRGLLARRGHG